MIANPFFLGVHYWPRCKGLRWWRAFDPKEAAEDFAHLRACGVNGVVLTLPWDAVQPEPHRLHSRTVDAFGKALDLAHDAGLLVWSRLFSAPSLGALSLPAWLLEEGAAPSSLRLLVDGYEAMGYQVKNFYEDADLLAAQRYLVREIVGYFAAHPAIWCWSVGDDVEAACVARSPDAVQEWLGTLKLQAAELNESIRLSLTTHQRSLAGPTCLHLHALAEFCRPLALRANPAESPVAHDPLDTEATLFALTLASALAGQPVALASLGIPTVRDPGAPGDMVWRGAESIYLASETEQAETIGPLLETVWQMGAPGLWLASYADYDEALWQEPPLDEAIAARTVGIVRQNGTEKPVCDMLRRFAARLSKHEQPKGEGIRRLEVEAREYYTDPARHFRRLWDDYREGGH